jgi:hypothetical protein
MQSHNTTSRLTALSLVLLLTFTLPLTAADKTAHATIGSVSSVGSVQLRGVALSTDGTLFSGDRLNVGPGSYARVIAGTGHKLEVGSNSDVVVSREGDNTNLEMASGNVAFKGNGKGSTRVRIGAFDVALSSDAAGNIAFVGSKAFGVRLSGGSATVRNTQTKKSFVVQKGSERIVSLTTGESSPTMAQLASTAPSAVPAMPRRQASSWNTGMWVSIVAAASASSALITYFLTREDDDETAGQIRALQNLVAIAQTAAATASVSAQASSVAGQAATAISASNLSVAAKAALQAQVNTVTSQANSAATKIASVNSRLTALQNAIANQEDGPTDQQRTEINTLVNDLNSARNDLAAAIAALNALLAAAASQGVGGLPPNPGLQVPPPPTVASASIPV